MPKVIKLENLKDGSILAKDIYINSSVLFRTGMLVSSELINYLKRKGVRSVSVFDAPAFTPFQNTFIPKSRLPEHQHKELTAQFQNEMTQIADELRYGRILHSEASYQWIRGLYLKFYSNPTVRFLMDCLKQWDPVCYIHSLDVFVLTSLFFKHVNWKVSQAFMLGCLLHDIGKLYTPVEILLKKGKLTQREYQRITEHTLNGYRLLKKMNFPEETCCVARSHHERLNGSGYPDHLHVDISDRHLILMMIVDVYSALTMNRSYRKPMLATKAMQILLVDSYTKHLFHQSMCHLFINFIHMFPPATKVVLTNGESGIVLADPTVSDILPKIKLWKTGQVIQLPSDLSVTVKTIIGWDSRDFIEQQRQTWSAFIHYLIDGDHLKALDCLDTMSDGMRIEEVFIKLFEHAMDEISHMLSLNQLLKAQYMVASSTVVRLISWKMMEITRQLRASTMGEIVIVNLDSIQGLARTKLMNDLFTINGWKTELLVEIDDGSMISEIVRLKKAKFLAFYCAQKSQTSLLIQLTATLHDEFPDLNIFVHGSHSGILANDRWANRFRLSTNCSELIRNMKYYLVSQVRT
ncbi:HD-GYP domain-containing protein [Sporolactobacillus inulinus]|uniref:HD-GYP domain-containing protein n=1 Tax=Sporolactobacillus inulinus CASD TaxID=1069536 RepID=A0A0U1QQJ7_9BACL|nr:HD domain-containing phosphohydrolase [Sporolactobacillus inulinus]KLI03074.1 hypothetical protein SINU_04645 [Sporolactobacillus inulinus CASD]GEB78365.1 hypothetical protein SIN01_27100 [Sporolactobacillus inulinus]